MLHDFLTEHRDAIIERARAKIAQRRVPVASPAELAQGVPLFLSQMTDLLREEQEALPAGAAQTTHDRAQEAVGASADAHGNELLREGLTVALEVGAALDAKERGLELYAPPVDPAIAIHVDGQLLASAVANLLQNAIKFSRAGGRVSMTVQQESGTTLIHVEDECGGLAQGDAETMFQPFDRRRTRRKGLGLGLKISREAVKANGGEIRVRDVPGKGCIFTIALPPSVSSP